MSTTILKQTNVYDPVAAATEILGDKWTPHIVRVLSEGPGRFCNLQTLAGGVNPRTLSARLSDLERASIVTKRPIPGNASCSHYELTQKGRDLLPVLDAMTAWGEKYT